MDRKVRYSSIDYEKEDVLEQINKRFKHTQASLINEIASSIESIAESTKSIGENHAVFLKVNKDLTLFLLETEKKKAEINITMSEATSSTVSESDARTKGLK